MPVLSHCFNHCVCGSIKPFAKNRSRRVGGSFSMQPLFELGDYFEVQYLTMTCKARIMRADYHVKREQYRGVLK